MVWTSHFLMPVSTEPNRMLCKDLLKIGSQKDKATDRKASASKLKNSKWWFPTRIGNANLQTALRSIYWDQYVRSFQRCQIFQINMATLHWCLCCQSCTKTGLKHCSHSRLTSWHVVTMQWVCSKTVIMGDRRNLFSTCQRKQNMTKKYQPLPSPQQK